MSDQAYLLLYRRRDITFKVPKPIPQSPIVARAKEDLPPSEEPMVASDEIEESTPMSISSTSQPSTSSAEVDDIVSTSTTQEELD